MGCKVYIYNKWYELTQSHRSTDPVLNNDATQLRNHQSIDFTRYGNTEHDLALCHTNDMVDAVNK